MIDTRKRLLGKQVRVAWRSLCAAIAVAALALATLIPIVGGIIALLALVTGIGAMIPAAALARESRDRMN